MFEILQEKAIRERFIFGLLKKDIDWQWIVDYIEQNYKNDQILDWKEWKYAVPEPITIFSNIIKKIPKIKIDSVFKTKEIYEMFQIALFINSKLSWEEAKNKVTLDHLKLFLLGFYVTKYLNKDNNKNFYIFWNLFINTNLYQIYNLSSLQKNKIEIINYIDSINIQNLQILKRVLLKNLNYDFQAYDGNLLKIYKDKFITKDTFTFQHLPSPKEISWQENTLINMLEVKYSQSTLLPAIQYTDGTMWPDIGNWNEDIVEKMKSYFGRKNTMSNFVIESVYYLKNRVEGKRNNKKYFPSKDIILLHFELISNAIMKKINSREIINSSSFKIIGCFFKDGIPSNIKKNKYFLSIIKWVNCQTNLQLEKRIIVQGYPLSSTNKTWIEESARRKFYNLMTIQSVNEFIDYLKQTDLVWGLDSKKIKEIFEKFDIVSKIDTKDIKFLPNLFIEYSKFLNLCFENNKISKELISNEIIRIQQIWENEMYDKILSHMHVFKAESSIPENIVNTLRQKFEKYPIDMTLELIPCNEDFIVKLLERIDDNPFSTLFANIEIDKIFPQIKDKVVVEKHKVDEIIVDYISKIKEKYSGLFYNQSDSKKIALQLLHQYSNSINYIFLLDEGRMYNKVKELSPIALIPYTGEKTVGLVTQLFPILENKIRRIGSRCGISPFKNNSFNDLGIKYKDPSSILTKVISQIYKVNKNLWSLSGFLFIYLAMYDSNSFNIRNDLIHGRKYLKGNELDLAFRCTLYSIIIADQYLSKINN